MGVTTVAKILFFSGGTTDGCSFYRCQEPARALRKMGHDAVSTHEVGLGTAASMDVVVFQRSAEPSAANLMNDLLKIPASQRPRIVYELDDDLLGIPERIGYVASHYQDEDRRRRMEGMMAAADRITVTNTHLADRVREIVPNNPDVRIVPNYVPGRLTLDTVPERKDTAPVIGWAGSATHKADFEQVIKPLRRVLRTTDACFASIGANYTHRLVTAGRGRVFHAEWVENVPQYHTALNSFDIGIAPLVDDPFNRSKSDIKLKEYAAHGIAPIASMVGPYAETLLPVHALRMTGHTAQDDEWWEAILENYVTDPEYLHAAKMRVLEWANENTLEAHIGEWEEALVS
jgi:hypothetical protein